MSLLFCQEGAFSVRITVKFAGLLETKRLEYPVCAFPLNLGKKQQNRRVWIMKKLNKNQSIEF